MELNIGLGDAGGRASWSKQDKIALWQDFVKLQDRGLSVERHEQSIEKWFVRDEIQKRRKIVKKKQKAIFRVWRTQDLRNCDILKNLPANLQHIQSREHEDIVKMMRSAVLELKYNRNLVQNRKLELRNTLSAVEFDLQMILKNKGSHPKMNIAARRSYVKFQDVSTLIKAAQFVNVSYKKMINQLEKDNRKAKYDLLRLQDDMVEMQFHTQEVEIIKKDCFERLSFFKSEFNRRYTAIHDGLESHWQRHSEMKDQHAELMRKCELEIANQLVQQPQSPDQKMNETIEELKVRVEEAQLKIRSLQNATRCLKLGDIEARLRHQLPEAGKLTADRERLREARVSLIARRKELEAQHDSYVHKIDVEYQSGDGKIDELRQKIAAKRVEQLKSCKEVEKVMKRKNKLISRLRALKFFLKDDDKLTLLGDEIDPGRDNELDDHGEAMKLVEDILERYEILVDKFNFNLPEEEVIKCEHKYQDKILKANSPGRLNKLEIMIRKAEKTLSENIDNVKFDTSDVPTRKDIKRMSRDIVVQQKTE